MQRMKQIDLSVHADGDGGHEPDRPMVAGCIAIAALVVFAVALGALVRSVCRRRAV